MVDLTRTHVCLATLVETGAIGVLVAVSPLAAQSVDSVRCRDVAPSAVTSTSSVNGGRAPFVSGERLEYAVSFGRVHVGSGEMQLAIDTLDGRSVWHADFAIDGGFSALSVHDTNSSWFDTTSLNSLRFTQRLHEPRYHADRDTRMSPETRTYQQRGRAAKPSVSDPLDDVSVVYFVRTLPLAVGECYELYRYFQPEGNPVVVHVVRRERITVPAGTFNAFVLRPEIRTSGVFSQNGHAELWLSDDSTHIVLQLKSSLTFGSINLYLRRVSNTQTPR